MAKRRAIDLLSVSPELGMIAIRAKVRKLASILLVPLWREALRSNYVAAAVEHAKLLRNLGPLRTVVDIGANRGQFALVARYYSPKASIISFEPLPDPAAIYRAVFSKDSHAKLYEMAIGPTEGEATIHISLRDDSSSLLPITAMQEELFPGTAESAKNTIHVVPLSHKVDADELKGPALLKLDVQGFELQALKGCEDSLEAFDWLYVECSFLELYAGQALADEVINWLHARGFMLRGLYNMTYDRKGHAVQADLFFSKAVSDV